MPPDAALPTAAEEALRAANRDRRDWISENGRPDRTVRRGGYRRMSDGVVRRTDPDATHPGRARTTSRLGYNAHYVVDGGRARVILCALVVPADVKDNLPMLDLLWRTCFRWGLRPHHVTGDSIYGSLENIKAVEDAGIRAFVPVRDWTHNAPGSFSKRRTSATRGGATSTSFAPKAKSCDTSATPTRKESPSTGPTPRSATLAR